MLLVYFYVVVNWDIFDGFFCLLVLGWVDYIYYFVDLLVEVSGIILVNVSILDIGVGVNCIYLLIGVYEYGWCFIGSEISSQVLSSV